MAPIKTRRVKGHTSFHSYNLRACNIQQQPARAKAPSAAAAAAPGALNPPARRQAAPAAPAAAVGNNNRQNHSRIPPPPPLNNHDAAARRAAPFPWLLRVRCPKSSSSASMTVICVQVTPEMTAEALGRCIGQAVAAKTSSFDGSMPTPAFPDQAVVAGLFGMHDGVFYSLQHILTQADEIETRNWMYSVVRPPPPPPLPPRHWTVWEWIALFLVVVGVVARYGDHVRDMCLQTIIDTYYLVLDFPFRELYRYGPKFVGWEGLDLSEICARITYHGDRSFWMRNMGECQNIYHSKEEAFVRWFRPVVYALLGIVTFAVVRHLVTSYAERKRDRTDRAVLDTYHAVQTLIRVANRAQRR